VPNRLPAPAKVIDGGTVVVSDQLVRLHGIDAPELDQTFWWRGQQIVCGTMPLAALEALIASVKVRCEVVERDRHWSQALLAQWHRDRPQAGISGVGPGLPAVLE
jgi:endonuclease YncB( thermonuclease family)